MKSIEKKQEENRAERKKAQKEAYEKRLNKSDEEDVYKRQGIGKGIVDSTYVSGTKADGFLITTASTHKKQRKT